MPWETAAIICAVGFAIKAFSCKAACRAGADALAVMVGVTAVSTMGFGLSRLLDPDPAVIIDLPKFCGVLIFCVLGATLANFCYFQAIHLAPLSVAMPLLALSPALMILTSRWMLGETPDAAGLAGILAIVSGIVMIQGGAPKAEVHPKYFRRGIFFALATSVVYSLTSNLDKLATRLADPLLYPLILQCVLLPVYLTFARGLSPGGISAAVKIPAALGWMAVAGLTDVLVIYSQMSAILQTHVAYVIAVKRSGAILAALLGWKFFDEKQIFRRIGACLLIVAGVAVLLLLHP